MVFKHEWVYSVYYFNILFYEILLLLGYLLAILISFGSIFRLFIIPII